MVPMSTQGSTTTQDTEHAAIRAELLETMETERLAGRTFGPLAMDALLRLDYLNAGFVMPSRLAA